MKRKIISLAMACICAITSFSLPVINVSAAETENVTETLSIDSDEIEEQKTEDCIVNADISGSFTITIPKKMILSGNDKKGSYEVTAKGDIAATEVINVVPEEKFVLSSTGKEDVETSVSQLKKAFSYSDVMKTEDGILVGSTTSGEVTSDNLTSGEWKGSFYFNINMAKVSKISVIAKDDSKTDLNASAYTIEGTEKDALLEKLISSGITDTVTSADDVDALIEVESDDFDNIAKTTFDVSNITEDGDKVVILHYNEETNEWEYIGTYEAEDGKVTADFTSYSPVAFVVVKEDGSTHIHQYVEGESSATCIEAGIVSYTCECGSSYTEEVEALGHNYVDYVCSRCGTLEPGLYDENTGVMTASWDELLDTGTITVTDGVLTSGYVSSYESYNTSSDALAGKLVIDNSVSSFGVNALGMCASLTSVTIPDSVTSIGDGAFAGTALANITIPDSVTSIEGCVFRNCASLTSVTIPDSVTSIGDCAFQACSSLTSVIIPDSVTTIGYGAFWNCTSLTNITIPDGVKSIGDSAFNYCSSLANITIPDSVTSIGTNAFCNCTSLSSITIPDSVTSISNSLFACCTGLTSITIPDSVTSIGNQAFSQCISLTNITIPDSVTSIGYSAFESCMSLKSIEIPDIVISIGNRTFYNCIKLTNIVIPNSVTSIGHSAFSACSSLENVTIPDSVTSIGNSAFWNCTSLTNITIPDGVKSIGDSTFYDCTSLTSVEIPNSVTSIANNAFYGCTTLTSVYIPNSVTTISASKYSYSPFYKCSSSLKIYCGASAKQSGWGTYWNYYSSSGTLSVTYSYPKEAYEFYSQLSSDATEVVIPDGITIIPNNAFYGFKSLTSVTIPDSVTSIGNSAFSACSSLENVTIPDSVTSIGNSVFYNCTSLTDVTIPDSVTSIGEKAFYGCTALTTIYIPSSVTTMVGYSSGINPFYYCSPSLKIYCEVSAKQSGWGGYWNYYSSSKTLSVTYGVTREEYEASYGFYLQLSSDVTEITIPDGITVIPDKAFYGFKNLTKVEIPDSVTSIDTQAFYNCTSLTTIYIPSSVAIVKASSYSYSPFYNCSSSLKIYCGASEAQSGWGTYWNYRNSSTKLSVTYGVTREEYESTYK